MKSAQPFALTLAPYAQTGTAALRARAHARPPRGAALAPAAGGGRVSADPRVDALVRGLEAAKRVTG